MLPKSLTIDPSSDRDLVFEVEQFLYSEAALLDQWRLHEWLGLFAPEGRYLVPSTDLPDGDPARDLFLIHDDRFLLEQRVNSLLTRAAHAEYPQSRTQRMISNVRVRSDGPSLKVDANVVVHRVRSETVDSYIGVYEHVLVRSDEGALQFLNRKTVLTLDSLRPHGKVSIIV